MKHCLRLTQAQRKQLSRPRPLLFLVVVGVLSIPWIALFLGDVYLRSQQAQMDDQAALFFSQTPDLPTNVSAYQFDQLSAQLGLEPNVRYTPPVLTNRETTQTYAAIAPALTEFINSQSNQVTGPLSPIPSELQHYLLAHTGQLTALQNHVLTAPMPLWATDNEEMVDSRAVSPGFVNVRAVQKLLLLLAIQASQAGRQAEMTNALEASWRLNEAIAQRSDLSSEVLVSVVSVWQAGVLRHTVPFADNTLSQQWQARLVAQSHVSPVLSGIRYESWFRYRITQQSWLPALIPNHQASILQKMRIALSNRLSFQTYYKLAALENTQMLHQGLDRLTTLDVCETSQVSAERILSDIRMASWSGGSGLSPQVLARRWKTAGNRALAMELSQHILAIKPSASASTAPRSAWPTHVSPIPSQVCPGESWLYSHNADGTISLELSKQLLTPGPVPLRYRSIQSNFQPQKP